MTYSTNQEARIPGCGSSEAPNPPTGQADPKLDDADRTPKVPFRRRRRKPAGSRPHTFSVRSTEAHLKFFYHATEGRGTLVEGFEFALELFAHHVLNARAYGGKPVSDEALEAAISLLKEHGVMAAR